MENVMTVYRMYAVDSVAHHPPTCGRPDAIKDMINRCCVLLLMFNVCMCAYACVPVRVCVISYHTLRFLATVPLKTEREHHILG